MNKEDFKVGMKVTWDGLFYKKGIVYGRWPDKGFYSRNGINDYMIHIIDKYDKVTVKTIRNNSILIEEDTDRWSWEHQGFKPLDIKERIKFLKI